MRGIIAGSAAILIVLILVLQIPLTTHVQDPGILNSPSSSYSNVTILNVTGTYSLVNGSYTRGFSNATSNGEDPQFIQYDSLNSRMYIVEEDSNSVSVFNVFTGKFNTSIPVGTYPVWASLDKNANLLFVANSQSNNISVISTRTNRVIQSINLNGSVTSVAYSQNDNSVFAVYGASNLLEFSPSTLKTILYVNLSGEILDPNGVFAVPINNDVYITSQIGAIIDFSPGTEKVSYAFDTGTFSPSLVFSSNSSVFYTTGTPGGLSSLQEISVSTDKVLKTKYLNAIAPYLAYDPAKNSVLVAYQDSNEITAYNSTNLTISGNSTMPFSAQPTFLSYVPYLNTVVLGNYFENTITYINPANLSMSREISVGEFPSKGVFDPFNGKAYFATFWGGDIVSVDQKNNSSSVVRGKFGNEPGFTYDSNSHSIYFTYGFGNLAEFFPSNNTVVKVASLGNYVNIVFDQLTYDPWNNMLYIGCSQVSYVFVLNTLNNTLEGKLRVGLGITNMEYDSYTHNVYVLFDGGNLSMINSTSNKVQNTFDIENSNYIAFFFYDSVTHSFYSMAANGPVFLKITPERNSTYNVTNFSVALNTGPFFSGPFYQVAVNSSSGDFYVSSDSGYLVAFSPNYTTLASINLYGNSGGLVYNSDTGELIVASYEQGNAFAISQHVGLKKVVPPTSPLTPNTPTVLDGLIAAFFIVAGIVIISYFRRKNE